MKTKELATWLGVVPATIRAWLKDEYGEFVSPNARGGDGRTRYFDELDARILAFVASLKNEGTPRAEILDFLSQLQKSNWDDLPPMPPAVPGAGPVSMMPREAAETAVNAQRMALTREIAILEDRVERLEEELVTERAKRDEVQQELVQAKERLGELRGQLTERKPSSWWLRVVVAVAVIVFVLTIVAMLLSSAGVG
jgi:DNA-binding transcriptional MerR regulator